MNLAGYDTASTPMVDSKGAAKDQLHDELGERLFDLHELLYAEAERSVLLVMQGLDCSGKGGTIKHVVITMNPSGVRTAAFNEPTDEERAQHFLERYRAELPRPGQLGVFDRSYYEDAIVPLATGSMSDDEVGSRIDEINTFEAELIDSGVTVVKCLLHLSFDEQRERFLRRLRRDDKRWKFSVNDMETRSHWNEHQAAYGAVVARTSTEIAPWYVIPSDHKWYRNWAVAKLLEATFEAMAPAYPQPELDLEDLRRRLEAPN